MNRFLSSLSQFQIGSTAPRTSDSLPGSLSLFDYTAARPGVQGFDKGRILCGWGRIGGAS
jgi:hypothetical protein